MLTITLTVLIVLVLVAARADRVPEIVQPAESAQPKRVAVLYRGRPATYWAHMYRFRTFQVQQAWRALRHRPSSVEAIGLACAVYGHCDELWRKARCESGLNPYARNGSEASGLFQFLPSTFRSTPFGRFSIFSPYANALAAGWMHSAGRGGEWVCR